MITKFIMGMSACVCIHELVYRQMSISGTWALSTWSIETGSLVGLDLSK